jgi:uncharacterized membrane protein (DUF373 family)
MTKDTFISKTESWVYLTLSILAILFIIIETVDLIYIFYKELSRFSFANERPLGLSGIPIFFNILITLEILETFKSNHKSILSKVKIVLLVAITAVVRKVITIDIKHSEYMMLISIALLLLSFCIGYYFLSKHSATKKSFHKK